MTDHNRRDKHNYYLDIAETVLQRSTCLRRSMGAIIVKDDQIISTGYAGAPRGRANCTDIGSCTRDNLDIPKGQRYELCRSVHAETNAIINASREQMLGSSLYLAAHDYKTKTLDGDVEPCSMCKRTIINAGIKTVYIRKTIDEFVTIQVDDWVTNDSSITGTQEY